jgi:PAS domain S-box-containing protein
MLLAFSRRRRTRKASHSLVGGGQDDSAQNECEGIGANHPATLGAQQMEPQLATGRGQQTFFTEHVPTAIAMFDTEMRYLAVSQSFLSLIEYSGSPAEVIGRSHYETFQDIPPHWRAYHARVLAGEPMAHAEEPLPRRDGRIDWVRWSMKPWYAADGRIGGALLAGDLITDEIKAQHAVAESEIRFRATFENAAVGIAHLSFDLRWLRANRTLCRIIGWPINELITKSLQEITHPDDLEVELAHVQEMRDWLHQQFRHGKTLLAQRWQFRLDAAGCQLRA